MPIFRRTNCIITTSGIVNLCKRLQNTPDESSLLSTGIMYCTVQRVTIPDVVIIRTICPPEDGHVDALNMSRIVM
jgi:hypothetical protein